MKLIVNADDFGYSRGVNWGIIEAHREGIVTSATMMVNMHALEHAVLLANDHPKLGVGIHLVLTCGRPLLSHVNSLTDEQGRFLRYHDLISRASVEEVEQEWIAQFERFLATGLTPTHLDSHHHVHAHEKILPVAMRLAERYQLPIRNPFVLTSEVPGLSSPVRMPERFLHQFYGENLTSDMLINLLNESNECQTAELMCHPAYLDEELLTGSSYNRPRARELQILTDPAVKEYIRQSPIQLASFKEIR
ncbi:chitin disaccharide deacetylase [Brevibacillus sp. SYSU BS000544]|uniref:chitin disaccharide deacetylase n=1 Tax=Brevibacillus sp. SYSU BS000544 TaxID=3416443 RepID=UPI003CE4D425